MKLNLKITCFAALILSLLLTLTNSNLHAKTFEYKGLNVGIPDSPDYVYWGINGPNKSVPEKFQKIFNLSWAQEIDPFKWYQYFDAKNTTEIILPLKGDLKTIYSLVDVSAQNPLTVSWIAVDQKIATFICYYFDGGLGVTHLINAGGEIIGVVRNSTSKDKSAWLSEGIHTLSEKGNEEHKGLPGRWSRSRKSFMPYAYHIDHHIGDKNDSGNYTHRGDISGNRSETGNSAGCNRHNGDVARWIYELPTGTTFKVFHK